MDFFFVVFALYKIVFFTFEIFFVFALPILFIIFLETLGNHFFLLHGYFSLSYINNILRYVVKFK